MSYCTFSVIIPVYNAAPWIRACLDSVLAAAEKFESQVEIVCVDDGSTDGSGAILDEYAARFESLDGASRLKLNVIHQPNAGVSAARNAGLEVATGDYVCFLDPDDVWAPKWLNHFATVIAETNADLVMAKYQTFFDGESPKFDDVVPVIDDIRAFPRCDGQEAKARLVRHFMVDGRCFPFTVRRNLLGGIRFPEGIRLAEDVLFCLQMAGRIESVIFSTYCGHGYRQRAESLTAVRLASAERLRFLRTFSALKPELFGQDASLMLWQMVQFWLVNAADFKETVAIRDELQKLINNGLLKIEKLPQLSRPGAWLYLHLPRWPRLVRFVHCVVYKWNML